MTKENKTNNTKPEKRQLLAHLYSGICVFNDRIYASDYLNQRIDVYKKSKDVRIEPPTLSSRLASLCIIC